MNRSRLTLKELAYLINLLSDMEEKHPACRVNFFNYVNQTKIRSNPAIKKKVSKAKQKELDLIHSALNNLQSTYYEEFYLNQIETKQLNNSLKNNQEISPLPQQPIDMKTFRLHLKEYLKERVRDSDRGITVWDCRGKIAFRFRSAKGLTDRSFVTKNFYWENKEDVAKVWEKLKRILRNYPYSCIGTSISKPVSQIPYKFKNNWEHSFAIYNLEQMIKLSLKNTQGISPLPPQPIEEVKE